MARPKKIGVDYFPHYANASTKSTIDALEGFCGNDGYAFWFKLLEILASEERMYIDCSKKAVLGRVLKRTHVSLETAMEIFELLAETDAIDADLWVNHKIVWSQNLVDNVAEVFVKRKDEIPTKPVSGTETRISGAETPVYGAESTQIKLNKIKLNNIPAAANMHQKISEAETAFSATENPARLVYRCYEQNIGLISPAIAESMDSWLETIQAEVICAAISEAVKNSAPRWSYVEAILRDCHNGNVHTLEEWNARQKQREQTRGAARAKQEPQPATQYTIEEIQRLEAEWSGQKSN